MTGLRGQGCCLLVTQVGSGGWHSRREYTNTHQIAAGYAFRLAYVYKYDEDHAARAPPTACPCGRPAGDILRAWRDGGRCGAYHASADTRSRE